MRYTSLVNRFNITKDRLDEVKQTIMERLNLHSLMVVR